jgi:hypothetical protein
MNWFKWILLAVVLGAMGFAGVKCNNFLDEQDARIEMRKKAEQLKAEYKELAKDMLLAFAMGMDDKASDAVVQMDRASLAFVRTELRRLDGDRGGFLDSGPNFRTYEHFCWNLWNGILWNEAEQFGSDRVKEGVAQVRRLSFFHEKPLRMRTHLAFSSMGRDEYGKNWRPLKAAIEAKHPKLMARYKALQGRGRTVSVF